MAKTKVKLNQLVDWNYVLWAGILSGLVSTHPNPENRLHRIQATIDELYPSGVPGGMIQ